MKKTHTNCYFSLMASTQTNPPVTISINKLKTEVFWASLFRLPALQTQRPGKQKKMDGLSQYLACGLCLVSTQVVSCLPHPELSSFLPVCSLPPSPYSAGPNYPHVSYLRLIDCSSPLGSLRSCSVQCSGINFSCLLTPFSNTISLSTGVEHPDFCTDNFNFLPNF